MKLALFSLLALTLFLHAQEAPPPAAPKERVWEYSVIAVTSAEGEEERLVKAGTEGWELVSVVYTQSLVGKLEPNKPVRMEGPRLRYYFKRLKAK